MIHFRTSLECLKRNLGCLYPFMQILALKSVSFLDKKSNSMGDINSKPDMNADKGESGSRTEI